MASARRLYRLYLALAAAGAAALLVALAVVSRAVTLTPASVEARLEACRRLLIPNIAPLTVAVLVVFAITIGVLVAGMRSVTRQLRASRRYVRSRSPRRATGPNGPLWLIGDRDPQAFCSGYVRPRIHISTGALAALAPPELEAVLAHERHHAQRHDPLRFLLARTVADALFFVPALARLADRYEALAELAADEAAFVASKGRQPLASALLVFGERHNPAAVVGIAPERVDHLLGEPAHWRLRPRIAAASVLLVAALVALPVLAATADSSVDLLLLAARTCMLLMAAVAAAFVISAALTSRSFLVRR